MKNPHVEENNFTFLACDSCFQRNLGQRSMYMFTKLIIDNTPLQMDKINIHSPNTICRSRKYTIINNDTFLLCEHTPSDDLLKIIAYQMWSEWLYDYTDDFKIDEYSVEKFNENYRGCWFNIEDFIRVFIKENYPNVAPELIECIDLNQFKQNILDDHYYDLPWENSDVVFMFKKDPDIKIPDEKPLI